MYWRIALLLVIVATGLLIPLNVQAQQPEARTESQTLRAEIVEVIEEGINELGPITQPYQILDVELREGDREGEIVQVEVGVIDLNTTEHLYEPGDQVFVSYTPVTEPGQEERFIITDRVRTTPMLVLAAMFAVAIIALGRWKGVRAIIGLAFTFAVIIWFMIPRILDGSNPVTISVFAAIFIFMFTLYIVHGIGRMTTAAVLGTSISLMVTGTLAYIWVRLSSLTGLASDEAAFIQVMVGGEGINMQGLLLGGIIIGALGVLDDVTVSQSSTVFELRKANPKMTMPQLFASGINVGRDHIAATVNTLVLAYAGVALPLLILFTQLNEPTLHIINREILAEEIVRTLVGSLGLICAVPLTTGIAAYMAVKSNPEDIAEYHHGHHH
ncbi:MAG: YibE/F family protein [Sphaerobacteraceae bacterium]|nr:MAG: YibE/F family protein [Sphaerobacteraceae bacterium]